MNSRQIIYESARLYPTLIHAHFECLGHSHQTLKSLDPTAMRKKVPSLLNKYQKDNHTIENLKRFPFGHAEGLLSQCKRGLDTYEYHGKYKYPGQYKYVIVPLGTDGMSTSGRLGGLLAYCGCVILLQESSFVYHFSARLKPWVHYVPLTYSMVSNLVYIFTHVTYEFDVCACMYAYVIVYRRM